MIKFGAAVFSALKGFTTRKDQETVINSTGQVNSSNVLDFLKDYNLSAKSFENKMRVGGTTVLGLGLGGVFGGLLGLGGGLLANNLEKNKPDEGFFSQLNSEYGFDEKQQVMSNVASKLGNYFANNGYSEYARSVKEIMNDGTITKDEALKLDNIISKITDPYV